MTRALQTACLGLATHPTLHESGLKLMCCAREYKNTVASLDCVANTLGAEIVERTLKETQSVVAEAQASGEVGSAIDFDNHPIFGLETSESVGESKVSGTVAQSDNTASGIRRITRLVDLNDASDVATEWWTPSLESDAGEPFERRLDEFMLHMRLRPEKVAIVVGHSYFIRALCDRYTHPDCLQQSVGRRVTLADLGESKVGNCGVVALNMHFGTSHTRPIVGGELLFGTDVGARSQGRRKASRNSSAAAGEGDAKKKLDFNSWSLGPSGADAAASETDAPPPPPPPPLA
jgi:hypothetical protein